MTVVDLAAIWGAGVATAVAIFELWKAAADRPSIRVVANLAFRATSENVPEYGTRIQSEHGLQEVVVEVAISNGGRRPAQIVSIFFAQESGALHQVISNGLPTVIEPGCRVSTTIQKEWLDDPTTRRLGAPRRSRQAARRTAEGGRRAHQEKPKSAFEP